MEIKKRNSAEATQNDTHSAEAIELHEWLKKQKQTLASVLLGGKETVNNPKMQMRNITGAILKDFDSPPVVLQQLRQMVQEFNCKQADAFLPLPEIALEIRRPSNPFKRNRWETRAHYWYVRDLVVEEMSKRNQEQDQEWRRARILVSAVLFGVLLAKTSLQAFLNVLPEWYLHADWHHGRLSLAWQTEGNNWIRFFPDAVTALLLLECKPQTPNDRQGNDKQVVMTKATTEVDEICMHYLRKLPGAERDKLPTTFAKFIDATLIVYEQYLPRALTEYAAGNNISYSLKPEAWQRIHGKAGTSLSMSEDAEASVTRQKQIDQEIDQALENDSYKEDRSWISSLCKLLGAEDSGLPTRSALHALKNREDDHSGSDYFHIFRKFSIYLIETALKRKARAELATIRRIVVALAKRLPAILKIEDLSHPSIVTISYAYQQVLEDAISANQRLKFASYIRKFHMFLVKGNRCEKINEGEVFGSLADELPVDANMITEKEFEKIQEYLEKQRLTIRRGDPGRRDYYLIASLIVSLGYWSGLRRSEALKLQLKDICENDEPEILVRDWQQRKLKTPNATRKIPQYALTAERDIQRLRAWKARREKEVETKPSPYFFSIASLGFNFADERIVFMIIHDAIRTATGDPTLNYHHLRHSFASRFVYSVMVPPGEQMTDWLTAWAKPENWRNGKEDLYDRLYKCRFKTRRHLYATARLLGHSSPAMSLEHYVHTMDQIFAISRERQTLAIAHRNLLMSFSSASRATIYRVLKDETGEKGIKSTYWDLVEKSWTDYCRQYPEVSSRLEPDAVSTISNLAKVQEEEIRIAEAFFQTIWSSLYCKETRPIDAKELADQLGLPEQRVTRLHDVATQAKQNRTGQMDVHLWEMNPVKAAIEYEVRIACPRTPSKERDLAIFRAHVRSAAEMANYEADQWSGVLDHYLYSARTERNGLEFRWNERHLARQYIRFLERLGVGPEHIRIRPYGESAGLKLWKKYLKGLRGLQQESPRPFKLGLQRENVLGIKTFYDNENGRSNDGMESSCGFKYLCVLMAIWVLSSDD